MIHFQLCREWLGIKLSPHNLVVNWNYIDFHELIVRLCIWLHCYTNFIYLYLRRFKHCRQIFDDQLTSTLLHSNARFSLLCLYSCLLAYSQQSNKWHLWCIMCFLNKVLVRGKILIKSSFWVSSYFTRKRVYRQKCHNKLGPPSYYLHASTINIVK